MQYSSYWGKDLKLGDKQALNETKKEFESRVLVLFIRVGECSGCEHLSVVGTSSVESMVFLRF